MQLLWLFFIISNLFYVFYFDENVFYFILFSVLFLPNFFNNTFYAKQISLFQYVHFLRTNLSGLILFFESTKNTIKNYLLVLFYSKETLLGHYSNVGLIFLFRFLAKNLIMQLEKKSLYQNLSLVDSFLLLFFQNNDKGVNVLEKKRTIANVGAFYYNKTDKVTGQVILHVINSKYNDISENTLLSIKKMREIFSLLEHKK